MKKVVFALVLSFLVFACALTNTAYEKKLQAWIGQPEKTLIATWGRPTLKVVMNDGTTLLSYTSQNTYFVPTEYFYDNPGWVDADMMYDPYFVDDGMPAYAQIVDTEVEAVCQTTFKVMDGIIQSYRFRGNGCR